MIQVLSALALSFASADDIDGPPDDCPPGSVGDSDHGGSYCKPVQCADDSACAPGFECGDADLCAALATVSGGRMGRSWQRIEVYGTCGGDRRCERGECDTVRVCIPRNSAPPVETPMQEPPAGTPMETPAERPASSSTESDDSCSVTSGSIVLPLAALLVLALGPMRRLRPPRGRSGS
jgi:hypothetical protein